MCGISRQTGLLREINLKGYNRDDVNSILRHWGFKKNADEALEYRTKQFQEGQLPYTPKAAELRLDENGKVIFPKWFSDREHSIQADSVDPYYRDPNRAEVDPSKVPFEVEDPMPAKLGVVEQLNAAPVEAKPVYLSSKQAMATVVGIMATEASPVELPVTVETAAEPAQQPHDEL